MMKRQYFLSIHAVFFILVFALFGCEGHFVGNREFNTSVIDAPYAMKIVQVGASGTRYLAVVNTNRLGNKKTGSLQFYSMSNPKSPSLDSDLTVSLPNDVSDFYLEDYNSGVQRLFILDRSRNKLLVYELSGGTFQTYKDNKENAVSFSLFSNPQSLVAFQYNSTNFLAINTQDVGAIEFFDLDKFQLITQLNILDYVSGLTMTDYRYDRAGHISAKLEMIARDSGKVQGISSGEQQGGGVGKIISLGGSHALLATASYTNTAVFGFRFSSFDDSSNVLWNLDAAQNGETVNGVNYPGTKESGFRGMDSDAFGNVYLSSISDNGIYKVTFDTLDNSRGSKSENTLAIDKDETSASGVSRIDINFEDDDGDSSTVRTDEVFPRLSDLAVDGQSSGQTATTAWVIGLESSDRGYDQSRIYMVDLNTPKILDVVKTTAGAFPEKLLYDQDDNLLYVANVGSNSIFIYDVSSGSTMEAISPQPLVN